MPLVNTIDMLNKAQKDNYAIGAFNVENMEMIQAAIDAAEEMQSPIILQTTTSTIKYADSKIFYAIVAALADNSKIPIALHLDHGTEFEYVIKAVRSGYTSVMIDGSHSSFDENIIITKKVAEICRHINVPVEAELGKVGGKEDNIVGDGPGYTNPDEAVEFIKKTGCTSLAIGVGTSHGIYSGEPKVDVERISDIRRVVEIPLVLHGTSGVPDSIVRDCIKRGMCKINYATDLRIKFSDAIKKTINDEPDVFDPKIYLKEARESVKNTVIERINVCGSVGKA